MKALSRIRRKFKVTFYYMQYNIIEISGKLSRLNYDEDVVIQGLNIINNEFTMIEPTMDGILRLLGLNIGDLMI